MACFEFGVDESGEDMVAEFVLEALLLRFEFSAPNRSLDRVVDLLGNTSAEFSEGSSAVQLVFSRVVHIGFGCYEAFFSVLETEIAVLVFADFSGQFVERVDELDSAF